MDFDIYTIGTGAFLEHAFNAIRLIWGGSGFIALLKLAVLVGLLILIVRSVFEFTLKSIILYFAKVTLITGIITAPIAKVHIIDKLPSAYGSVDASRYVEKIPLGLAAMASFTSTIGNWIGEKFEDSYSAVFPYKRTSLLFGSKIVEDISDLRADNADIKTLSNDILMGCILPDIDYGYNRKNGYTENDLKASPNILAFLKERASRAKPK